MTRPPRASPSPTSPGAWSAGDSLEEAYDAAVEVAHIRLEALALAGEEIPMPSSVKRHRANPAFAGMSWALLEIDITSYLGKAEQIEVTLPSRLLRRIDHHVERCGLCHRSSFLIQAALEKLERQG